MTRVWGRDACVREAVLPFPLGLGLLEGELGLALPPDPPLELGVGAVLEGALPWLDAGGGDEADGNANAEFDAGGGGGSNRLGAAEAEAEDAAGGGATSLKGLLAAAVDGPVEPTRERPSVLVRSE
ncbi:hypothetical protein FB45DRAFT_870446 [Roridomyces roridus]|uniref:Uncharacterized protein n=1 Tax=Roridomyces roridus TaxID=1738132 RepID=A0AAD7BIY8_9AGAR|nr:hypothetical protein FB45DRAFT_870446 [Roridomyces roridus]